MQFRPRHEPGTKDEIFWTPAVLRNGQPFVTPSRQRMTSLVELKNGAPHGGGKNGSDANALLGCRGGRPVPSWFWLLCRWSYMAVR